MTPKIYQRHEGTLIIAGDTSPNRAGACAFHFLERGLDCIEFLCIGANAGQQAMKAMGVFAFKVEHADDFDFSVAFQPIRVQVEVKDHKTRALVPKDAVAWRAVIIDRKITSEKEINDTATDNRREDRT